MVIVSFLLRPEWQISIFDHYQRTPVSMRLPNKRRIFKSYFSVFVWFLSPSWTNRPKQCHLVDDKINCLMLIFHRSNVACCWHLAPKSACSMKTKTLFFQFIFCRETVSSWNWFGHIVLGFLEFGSYRGAYNMLAQTSKWSSVNHHMLE